MDKRKYYLNMKTILFFLAVLFFSFFVVNEFCFRPHSERASIFLIDAIPRHTKRWVGGVKELSPAAWNAHALIEGKNVVCGISSSLYSKLKKASVNKRIALVNYHYSLVFNEIICDQISLAID